MLTKAYFDENDNLVNIGEWDYGTVTHKNGAVEIRNPKPDNLVEKLVEVVTSKDGGKYLKSDYARLRQAAYPDFRDYLDGVVKGDQSQVQSYIDACLAVKTKYPKTEG